MDTRAIIEQRLGILIPVKLNPCPAIVWRGRGQEIEELGAPEAGGAGGPWGSRSWGPLRLEELGVQGGLLAVWAGSAAFGSWLATSWLCDPGQVP